MRVRIGWTGQDKDGCWRKFDIELDDSDGEREWPGVWPRLSRTRDHYQLLQSLAESVLFQKLVEYGYPQDKAVARQADFKRSIEMILASVQTRELGDAG